MRIPVLPVKVSPGPIPRIVHQVWVGSTPPEWVLKSWSEWKNYGREYGFDVRQWTSSSLGTTLSARLAVRYDLPPIQFADLLRIELVALQGGIYMDSDTTPIRSMSPFVGDRSGWLANGQDWIKSGEPTVSNAMFGFPPQHVFLSRLFEHAAKAVGRGLTKTFAIAGPQAYRQLLNEDVHDVEVLSEQFFPAYRRKQKDAETRLGRPYAMNELRELFPAAYVVHRSATSWVEKS